MGLVFFSIPTNSIPHPFPFPSFPGHFHSNRAKLNWADGMGRKEGVVANPRRIMALWTGTANLVLGVKMENGKIVGKSIDEMWVGNKCSALGHGKNRGLS
jgi:hypothetical protein